MLKLALFLFDSPAPSRLTFQRRRNCWRPGERRKTWWRPGGSSPAGSWAWRSSWHWSTARTSLPSEKWSEILKNSIEMNFSIKKNLCIGPLHNCWNMHDLGLEFAEIFVTGNQLHLVRLLKGSLRGVIDSPYRWWGESPTKVLLTKKTSILQMQRVTNSRYRWCGESPLWPIQSVANSAHGRYREWIAVTEM